MPVNLVATPLVDQYWPALREGFHEAIMATGGDITTGDLWAQCRNGSAFLVIAHTDVIQGASIWRPEVWQTGPKLRCLALYGSDMAEWIDDMKAMAEKIAGDCGSTALVSEGRAGWAKIFPKARKVRILYEETLS